MLKWKNLVCGGQDLQLRYAWNTVFSFMSLLWGILQNPKHLLSGGLIYLLY